MKTKGKEFVKIIDIWDSSAELTKKKNYKVIYQSKVTQFIGYERELTREVHWFLNPSHLVIAKNLLKYNSGPGAYVISLNCDKNN